MVEINIPDLSSLQESMNEFEYWATIVIYVIMGILILIVAYVIYKVLSCAFCLGKCVLCPFTCCCRRPKKKELLKNDGLNPPLVNP